MPSPPLQPRPRSWRDSLSDEMNPDYAALLTSFEDPPESSTSQPRDPAPSDPGYDNDESGGALGSPWRLPEIRATSPSPRRPIETSAQSDGSVSPLPDPPSRAQIFGDAPSSTQGRMMGLGDNGPSGFHTALRGSQCTLRVTR